MAEHILWLRNARDEATTPMHVIKLVYIAHGWMLGIFDIPLIDEEVEAWKYGPVISSVYHRFKFYGGNAIDIPARNQAKRMSKEQSIVIKRVVEEYSKFTALQLSTITHFEKSPWSKVVNEFGVGTIIPNQIIRQYYVDLWNDKND
ncbi:MAG: DUF4065 domain-containing protein [Bacteroidetes bacterium]|nr:DUF4065 domain-containing protein [Bacteroidota bacterium]